MFPFSQAAHPVLRSHLDTQFAFFNDLSRTVASSINSVCAANLKLSQTMIEETMIASQRMFAPVQANKMLGAFGTRAQADEAGRVATHEAEHRAHQDEAGLKNYRDPFEPLDAQRGNGNPRSEASPPHAREGAGEGVGASMQFEGLQDNGAMPGKVQGPVAQPTQPADDKPTRR